MTVTIDPSDVRTSKAFIGTMRRIPLRPVLIGGLGGVGLLAFAFASFSFFSDLADPRARTPRRATIAVNLPDMRDGVPPLAPSAPSATTVSSGTTFNLPSPHTADAARQAAPEPVVKAAAQTQPDLSLRRDPEPSAEAAPATTFVADANPVTEATGSVAKRPDAALRQAGMPPIQNAQSLAGEPKAAALIVPSRTAAPIAPAKAETVRAKTAAEPRAYAGLPPEPEKADTLPATSAPTTAPAPAEAAAKPKRKPVQARNAAPKPVAVANVAEDAAPAPAAPAAKTSDDPEVMGVPIPGGRQIKAGFQAMFGGSDEN